MPDDYSANAQTTGTVAVGGSTTGTIETAYDRDWFAVELVAGRTYVIDLRGSPTDDGTLSDPYLRGIHDADGNRISNTTNDDGGQSYNSRVTFTATESGTHYIAAGAYSSRRGTYEVEVTDTSPPMVGPDVDSGDPPDSQQQPPAFGSQFYAFDLAENADGSANRISLGTVSATDPDGGSVSYGIAGGNESGRFEIDAASGELFYVGGGEDYETGATSFELTVRASDGDETTDTSVTVNVTDVDEPVEDNRPVVQPDQSVPQTVSEPDGEDFSADPSTSGRVAVGDTATGTIGTAREKDWFAVELVAGRTYVIDLRGSPTDDGTLRDPLLHGIYDADGNRISGTLNDDGGQGYNSRVSFTATESGTHYIAAGAYFGLGTYEVEVTDTSPPIEGQDPDTEGPPDRQEQVQQQPPAFGSQFYGFELEENADGSVTRLSLGTVSATDPDGGPVSYGIAGGNESGRFEIDAASGEVFYVGTGEDYETGATRFELTVRASDGDRTTDTTVTVNVTDVDEPVAVEPPVAQEVQSVPQTVSEGATDLPNDNSTPGRVAVGGSVTGTIGAGRDQDRFAVELVAGRTYKFDLEGSPGGGGTLPDAYFRAIYNSAGRYQSGTYNDDFEGSRDSRVTFTPEESGTYYARVSGDRNETGTYTLSVTDVTPPGTDGSSTDPVIPEPQEPTVEFVGPDQDAQQQPQTSPAQGEQESVSEGATDLPTDTTTTGRVVVGGSATGNIERSGDRDWFAVDLEAGKTYRFDLKGSGTGGRKLENPYLRGIRDGDGERIDYTQNDNGGAGRNSRVHFTPDETATYYVAAGASHDRVGAYTLSVTEVTDRLRDDYSAGSDTAGTVTVGSSATGSVDYSGDEDWFAVELEAGKTYRLELKGSPAGDNTLADPYLRGIHDADGERIANTTDDDDGEGNHSRVIFTPGEAGTYYVAAGADRNAYTGTYTLSVTEVADDYAADSATTGTVAVGGSVGGYIEPPGDEDWFAVELEAGRIYRFDLERVRHDHPVLDHPYLPEWLHVVLDYLINGPTWDPYLRGIYDAEGSLIDGTPNDDGGRGRNSRVYLTPQETGTYYVSASADGSHSGGDSGAYTLSVTEVTDDHGAAPDTAGTVAVDGSVEGGIEPPGDQDWFAVELEAGTRYQFHLKGAWTGDGTLSDPYLRGIHDADGNEIPGTQDNNGGECENSRVTFTPVADGTYYVSAGADESCVGTYTLSVEEVDGM